MTGVPPHVSSVKCHDKYIMYIPHIIAPKIGAITSLKKRHLDSTRTRAFPYFFFSSRFARFEFHSNFHRNSQQSEREEEEILLSSCNNGPLLFDKSLPYQTYYTRVTVKIVFFFFFSLIFPYQIVVCATNTNVTHCTKSVTQEK